jgi:hypothetical protein
MLTAYFDKATPWPWDRSKNLEQFMAYESDGEGFTVCWPVDSVAEKAAASMTSTAVTFSSQQQSVVQGLSVAGFKYGVCATSTQDPVVVKLGN